MCIYVSHQVPFESRKTGPLYLRNLSSLVAINIPLHCLISTINCWWILNFKMWFSWYQIVIWICSSLAFGLITISAGWYWCVYGGACYELSWSSGKNTQQNGICIAKSHLSQKPSETVGGASKNLSAIHCSGHLSMDTLALATQRETTSTNCVTITDVFLKIFRMQWTFEPQGEQD